LGPRNDVVEDWFVATVGFGLDDFHVLVWRSIAGDEEVVGFGDVDVVDLDWVEQDFYVVGLV
jgi:hypothetical protein